MDDDVILLCQAVFAQGRFALLRASEDDQVLITRQIFDKRVIRGFPRNIIERQIALDAVNISSLMDRFRCHGDAS